MPSHTIAVTEAATAVGISIHSLRRWCEFHAAYLSPGANPTAGQPKRLTGVDIEVLRHVKALRSEGLQTIAINDKLSGLTFAEIDAPIEDIAIVHPDAPDVPESTLAPMMDGYITLAIQGRIEALELANVTTAQNQRAGWWWLIAGIGIGLGLAVVFELFALIASRGHG